jgi:hypothetical protein
MPRIITGMSRVRMGAGCNDESGIDTSIPCSVIVIGEPDLDHPHFVREITGFYGGQIAVPAFIMRVPRDAVSHEVTLSAEVVVFGGGSGILSIGKILDITLRSDGITEDAVQDTEVSETELLEVLSRKLCEHHARAIPNFTL